MNSQVPLTLRLALEPNLNQFFNVCPEILCLLKSNFTIQRVNMAFTQIFGWESQRIQGRSLLDFVHSEWVEQAQLVLEAATTNAIAAFETLHCRADGNQTYLTWSFSYDPHSQTILGIARVSEAIKRFQEGLLQENFKLTELANTDPLTELMNRRGFLAQLHHYQSYAVRSRSPFSLLLLDVDHFKQFNDSYGHTAGDQALVLIAHILRTNLRSSDLAGRYGGEEFIIGLPDSDQLSAGTVAESLRQAVESQGLPLQGVTISIGMATAHSGEDCKHKTAQALIDEADLALYHCKQSGRNCSTHHATL